MLLLIQLCIRKKSSKIISYIAQKQFPSKKQIASLRKFLLRFYRVYFIHAYKKEGVVVGSSLYLHLDTSSSQFMIIWLIPCNYMYKSVLFQKKVFFSIISFDNTKLSDPITWIIV